MVSTDSANCVGKKSLQFIGTVYILTSLRYEKYYDFVQCLDEEKSCIIFVEQSNSFDSEDQLCDIILVIKWYQRYILVLNM